VFGQVVLQVPGLEAELLEVGLPQFQARLVEDFELELQAGLVLGQKYWLEGCQ
jgi:hypothetical protein